jgi:hypothetical protein
MSEEFKKERSPNCPKISLEYALELVKKLYAKAGKAQIRPEVAVGPLGYSGLNGAALGTLGALSQYGLVDRERGQSVAVSPLAVKLIHPLNPEQEATSKREAALNPKVFNQLFTEGYHQCSEDVLANHLVQSEFTHDSAKRIARVYKENAEFANLDSLSSNKDTESSIVSVEPVEAKSQVAAKESDTISRQQAIAAPILTTKKMLAQYAIPLGSNDAHLTFSGEFLTPEDFDALIEYVELFKKQFERKLKDAAEVKRLVDEYTKDL